MGGGGRGMWKLFRKGGRGWEKSIFSRPVERGVELEGERVGRGEGNKYSCRISWEGYQEQPVQET